MSDTTVPTSSIVTTPDRNPLGRVALAVAIVQILVSGVAAAVTPIIGATATSMEEFQQNMWITGVSQIAAIVLAVIALVLGIIAWSRRGLPRTAACLAVGIAGSTVIAYALVWIGGLIAMAIAPSPMPVPIPG